jgi:hypothetical protein
MIIKRQVTLKIFENMLNMLKGIIVNSQAVLLADRKKD